MTDVLEKAGQDSAGSAGAEPERRIRGGWARPLALIAGLLAVLSAVAVPLLPVEVDNTTLSWPQGNSTQSIEAPLVSYAPLAFDATIPCSAVTQLGSKGGTLAATAPNGAPDLERYGFVARVTAASTTDGVTTPGKLEAITHHKTLVSIPTDQLPAGCALTIHSDMTATTATLSGSTVAPVTLNGDYRPQLVGIYSDLTVSDGAKVTAQVDSRFTSTPSTVKRIAIWTAITATLVALFALYRLDRLDGRRSRRFLPRHWWTFKPVDAVVLGTLVLWHFIGATTSDDGYQYGMGRASIHAGYMANYFGYFGVPETPVGTPYYDLIGHMAQISPASVWMRLPALLAGIVIWLVISREVIPRLGARIRHDRVAVWTGALGFLAVWLPYNNGLRPEPLVALGVLLTWVSVERAIATGRLLPYGIAIMIGAFSCTVGPSGIICFAPLLAGIRPIWRILNRRATELGKPTAADASALAILKARFGSYLSLSAPLAAAGAVVLVIMFCDQPLASMFEMSRVHTAVGPDVHWDAEYIRYQYLFMPTIDGSLARRFGMLAFWIGLLVSAFVLLRKGGRIPFTAPGPVKRVLGTGVGIILLMMFTPTKWTHHNGIYAGIAGVIAVLAAVAVGPRVLRSPRNRALFGAVIAFALALSFASWNGYWYVSNWAISWNDKSPVIAGFEVSKIFLGLTVLMLGLAGWFHVRAPQPAGPHRISKLGWRFVAIPPLTVAAAFMVLFEVASLAKGAIAQYPAYSLARSNIDAVLGKPCGLANDVLVEQNPNKGMLKPVDGDALGTFTADAVGFTPKGVATDLRTDDDVDTGGNVGTAVSGRSSTTVDGTTTAPLPFGLDANTPVLGSYNSTEAVSTLTTGWYALPTQRDSSGIIAMAAAGRIRSVDTDGIVTPGQQVEIEYGVPGANGAVEPQGRVTPIDIGPAPTWRNLRVPLNQIPAQATAIRVIAEDRDGDPKQWVALTPPRIPQTVTLQDFIGRDKPVLLDWEVGLQFPCQRPFDHLDGIAEVPDYRILPDRGGAAMTTLWQSHDGGGALGWSSMLLRPVTLATFLANDPRRDWGELQVLDRIDKSAQTAKPVVTTETRSGRWTPGPINVTGWQ
ncbi:arabinosyltransferase domain-containing protein [Nocardia seriolae]|uniref:Arabinosyltransferase n=1 Tax=Nocardia seriolae TaxID=37332 RepID=A0ABC8ATE4_9NOCA|nr:arabinosyltransferase domain-containing protein [Nocardia seriolae]APA97431.1 putative arabinosyltransferase [Nocardia seriolae]WNJ61586.1 arabinosyltransferase domain-containing protein [Nocardia seriolae]